MQVVLWDYGVISPEPFGISSQLIKRHTGYQVFWEASRGTVYTVNWKPPLFYNTATFDNELYSTGFTVAGKWWCCHSGNVGDSGARRTLPVL